MFFEYHRDRNIQYRTGYIHAAYAYIATWYLLFHCICSHLNLYIYIFIDITCVCMSNYMFDIISVQKSHPLLQYMSPCWHLEARSLGRSVQHLCHLSATLAHPCWPRGDMDVALHMLSLVKKPLKSGLFSLGNIMCPTQNGGNVISLVRNLEESS